MKKLLVPVILVFALSGCQANKQTGGSLLGAGAGGAAGFFLGDAIGGPALAAAFTGMGVLIGSMIGGEVGASLDRADELYAAQATNNALENSPSNRSVTWSNPDSGNRGEIFPGEVFYRNGTPCRNYTHTIYVGGQRETLTGVACRNNDGTWSLVN